MENAEKNCRQVVAELYAYLDGELQPPEGVAIEAHLLRCLPCHKRADFERDLKVFISSRCREASAPEDLLRRIRSALEDA
jgi:mycothiol system anti-sigma-R factor